MEPPMRRSRREVLRQGAGLALFAALQSIRQPTALAQGTAGAAARRLAFGASELVVLSDGHMVVPADMLAPSVPQAELRAFLTASGVRTDRVDFHINVALVRAGDEYVLIDAGAGLNWEATAGRLPESMEQAGVKPEQIGTVIVTHAHPDHLWGLIDEFDDSLRFPKARVVMSDREFTFWMDEAANLKGPIEGIAAGARRVLKAIEGRLTRIKPGAEITPGIVALDTTGHTPGHISLLVGSGAEKVLVTADAIQNAHVAFAHPDWQPRADMDGATAAKSRRRLLDMAAQEKLTVLSYHIPFPGLGRVESRGGQYLWVPAHG